MDYWAHSPNESEKPHALKDHLKAVADLAAEFASVWGGEDRARAAGLLHDLGKYRAEFQRYLRSVAQGRRAERVRHSQYGAYRAQELQATDVSLCIAGHHGGLPDLVDLKERLAEGDPLPIISAAFQDFPLLDAVHALPVPEDLRRNPLAADLHTRMLFSCLVDADFLDTERHLQPEKAALRTEEPLRADELLAKLIAHIEKLPAEGPVNARRREVLQACLAAGQSDPGFFSLTVPTGGGKTLSSMAFALAHAKAYGLRRVICVIPYLSIIEQNAEIFEAVLGGQWVLQHHSLANIDPSRDEDDENLSPDRRYALLATENWDAPIIVTTTVQFFESLFANRPSACRKLHNIPRSVIVFDECQTLPPGLLEPILSVLQTLRDRYSVSMVFCTATQPAFERSSRLPQGLDSVREIVPDPSTLFSALRRTNVRWPRPDQRWSWDVVAEQMRAAPNEQALCVVNMRSHARELLNALAAAVGCDVHEAHAHGLFHLSTWMCPAHRLNILAEIRRRLRAGQPCLVASTQLVEAGVDLDFPMVLRALGPLDSIAQAAGRCNREGLLHEAEVIVFVPEEDKAPPGWYEAGREVTRALLGEGDVSIHDPGIFRRYFGGLYSGGSLDQRAIQEKRKHLDFERVAREFRIIHEPTRTVIVKFDERAAALMRNLEEGYRPTRELMRQLQPYTVNVYEDFLTDALTSCQAAELLPGIYAWEGGYDPVFGIVSTGPQSLIV